MIVITFEKVDAATKQFPVLSIRPHLLSPGISIIYLTSFIPCYKVYRLAYCTLEQHWAHNDIGIGTDNSTWQLYIVPFCFVITTISNNVRENKQTKIIVNRSMYCLLNNHYKFFSAFFRNQWMCSVECEYMKLIRLNSKCVSIYFVARELKLDINICTEKIKSIQFHFFNAAIKK